LARTARRLGQSKSADGLAERWWWWQFALANPPAGDSDFLAAPSTRSESLPIDSARLPIISGVLARVLAAASIAVRATPIHREITLRPSDTAFSPIFVT
jgi:hypothetical protein